MHMYMYTYCIPIDCAFASVTFVFDDSSWKRVEELGIAKGVLIDTTSKSQVYISNYQLLSHRVK